MSYGALILLTWLSATLLAIGAWISVAHRKPVEQMPAADLDVPADVMSQAADLYWQTNLSGIVTGAGGRLMPTLVPDIGQVVGKHYLKSVALQPHEMTKMLSALTSGEAYSDIHSRFQSPDGKLHIISLSGTPRYDQDGKIVGYFGLGTDVTERVAAQDELKFLADHDPLTGLANRRAFEERMAALVSARERPSFAIFAIDLDGFKAVNDQYGHDTGDVLLQTVADRIRESTRTKDWAARVGGDEFVFIAEEVEGPAAAATLAQRLIDTLGAPYQLGGQTLKIGASVGVCLSNEPKPRTDDLLKHADMALYDAKAAGKGCFRFRGSGEPDAPALEIVRKA